ncbi:MAG: Re/Si-specific NAD(P)(+) transhydrogenase subunit alpha [Cyclobacteriaceae bacterium]
MKIGILKETEDSRVAISPDVVGLFVKEGHEILAESGAGDDAYFDDDSYQNAGAQIFKSAVEVLSQAELIVTLSPLDAALWKTLKSGAIMISCFQPYVDSTITDLLQKESFTVFSMDMIPRTTLAQSMDVLSSMASIAGYRAVLEAAEYLPRYFPMLSSAAGTVAPSKVLVLGAGVAGLQAIATAKRLGAIVEAFDTRAASKEEVNSLGAKFVEVEGAKDDKGAGGYAVEQTEEYKQKQRALIAEKAAKADVIISTAQVRGPKAPLLITKEVVEKMQAGSVIVDLAASTGGNCELTKNNQVIKHKGVTIIGNSNLASKVSSNASQMFGKNVFNFLKPMINEGAFAPDWDNVIVKESCIARPKDQTSS